MATVDIPEAVVIFLVFFADRLDIFETTGIFNLTKAT